MPGDEWEFGIIASMTKCTITVLMYRCNGRLLNKGDKESMIFEMTPAWDDHIYNTYKIRKNKKGEYWHKHKYGEENATSMSLLQPVRWFERDRKYTCERFSKDNGMYVSFITCYG